MLFFWSKEPVPGPKVGPWFAWFAAILIFWGCKRRITRSVLAASPLRLLKRRNHLAITNPRGSPSGMLLKQQQQQQHQQYRQKQRNPIIERKNKHPSSRPKLQRLYIGDGPHVPDLSAVIQTPQQIHYRVTRSGRVYGKYPNKVASPNNS